MSSEITLVADRYEIESTLGVGAQGRTFLAFDRETEERVALKRLTLADASNWKAIELFKREGNALRDLDHGRIPGYIDAFSTEGDKPEFFLAQAYVEGDNLQTLIDRGETWSNEELTDFLEQMLSILVYMESRRPPVVHRDIKPKNIIRSPDGHYNLIDFGAVQSELAASTGSSTVIGTGGFVPVEQLMGRASPQSDQYALAATAIYLASGRHPSNMESVNLRLQFRREVTLRPTLANLLEKMLEPRPDERYDSARDALRALQRQGEESSLMKPLPLKLDQRRVELHYEDGAFVVEVSDHPVNVIKLRAGVGLVVAGLISSVGYFWNTVLGLMGMPFLALGALLVVIAFQGNRQRRLELQRGELTVRRFSFGIPRGESKMLVSNLVDVVAESGGVHLFDATQTVTLPNLEGSSDEVARQIRVHAGLSEEDHS